MMPAIKAEFRKLMSIRSTYLISLIFLFFGGALIFFAHGIKDSGVLGTGDPAAKAFVEGTINIIAGILSTAGALIGLLLITHEYRHNTIIYTLTATTRRSKALAAKIIAIMSFVLVYSVVSTAILVGLVWAGVAVSGRVMPPQDINFLTFFVKIVFFCEAFALSGLLFGTLIRNQIGAIAVLLIYPNTIEGLLGLLFKHNAEYLPFTALQRVVMPAAGSAGAEQSGLVTSTLSPLHGGLLFALYLVAAWVIAWILFVRRDAN